MARHMRQEFKMHRTTLQSSSRFGFEIRFVLGLGVAIALGLPCLSADAFQQSSRRVQQDDRPLKSELGERQRLVERKMRDLEEQLVVIAERLREKEPQRYKRLTEAYQQAKERLITWEMAEISNLLDQDRLSEAYEKLEKVIENLAELIRLLMNEKPEAPTKSQEIQNLQRWQKAIQNLQDEQRKQVRETNKVANKKETLNRLDGQIKELDGLIKDQQSANAQSQGKSGSSLHELDKLADKQFDIRKRTEELAKEIAKDPTAEIGKPKDPLGKPNQNGNGDQQNPDNKPSDQKPNDPSAGDQKPTQGKPADVKPGDGKSDEGKPGQGKSGQGKPSQGKSQQKQPGQKPLESASEKQRRAEEKLGSGKTKEAARQQDSALNDLEKAKAELQKERRRIASLPPEAFKAMADKQRRSRDKALEIAKQMKKAPTPSPKDGEGNQNANQQQQQQPGQQKMEEAAEAMKQASGDLDQQQADKAEKKQQDANKKLEEALEEIEERLNQLREETRAEKLARLEGRFREMLERQQLVSIETIELSDKAENLGQLKRRDQLTLLRLSTEELEISEIGQQAYDLLLEDGTSDVFPEVVQAIRDDLAQIVLLLEDERTDELTQLIQKDVEGALQELLEALKDAKKSGGGGGGGGQGGPKQPLLKKSHEYKILRFRQQRINRRTKQLDRLLQRQEEQQLPSDPNLDDELNNTAEEQEKLLQLTEELINEDG